MAVSLEQMVENGNFMASLADWSRCTTDDWETYIPISVRKHWDELTPQARWAAWVTADFVANGDVR